MGINYGYIRVSASDQNESRQLYAMEKNGIKQKNIFVDKQSGKNFERKQRGIVGYKIYLIRALICKKIFLTIILGKRYLSS